MPALPHARRPPAATREQRGRRGIAAGPVLMDRPDLPAAPGERLLGLLRAKRHPARLRRQPGPDRGRLCAGQAGRRDPLDLEPAALLHRRQAGRPARRYQEPVVVLRRRRAWHPPGGVVDRPHPGQQRPSAREPGHRPGLRDQPDQHDHARARLGLHRDLPDLGRLGRLLRPRGPAGGRRERLRAPGARPGHQPVRQAGLHRPPDPVLRRVQQVHRGRLPRRRQAGPRDRRPARPAPRRPRGREDPRRPDLGLRLQPAAQAPRAAAHPSRARASFDPRGDTPATSIMGIIQPLRRPRGGTR